MLNNPIYKRLKQAVIENSYSNEQIKALTAQQISEFVGCAVSNAFCNSSKRVLAGVFEEEKNKTVLEDFKKQLVGGQRLWLENNYPDAEFEIENSGNKPCVKVWLEGKPQ